MSLEIGIHAFPVSTVNSIRESRHSETDLAADSFKPDANVLTETPYKPREQNLSALKNTVSQLNDSVRDIRRELHFSVDESSGRVVVKVINAEDGETIRQIPSEELLQLARQFNEGGTEGRLLEVIA